MTSLPTPKSFDHVALWVADRDAISDLLCRALGHHVIDRTDNFTLVGADARQGKLTLFDAEGPRSVGPLERIAFRVRDLGRAADAFRDAGIGGTPDDLHGPEGLRFALVAAGPEELDGDLDHVVLRVPDPATSAAGFARLGFTDEGDGHLAVGDRHVRLEPGSERVGESPLLNHLALLVDKADDHIEAARGQDFEITDIKDAANTYAGFVRGPDNVIVEFVEHKPTFALV